MVSRAVTLKGHMHVCPWLIRGHDRISAALSFQPSKVFVSVDGVPVATVRDSCLCRGVPTTYDKITEGSSVATIEGKKVARMGDSCAHGEKLVQGVPWLTFE